MNDITYLKKAGFVFLLFLMFTGSRLLAQNKSFLSFDGVDDYVRYPNDNTLEKLNGISNYTFEAWVYVAADTPDKGTFFRRTNQFTLYYRKDTKSMGIGLWAYVSSESKYDWVNYHSNDNTLLPGTWHHIAVIRNKNLAHFLHIYIDGTDEISGQFNGYDLKNGITKNLYIGDNGNGNYYLKGYIDEIRIKDTATAPADLQSTIYDNQYKTDNHTVALFHLNEGSSQNTVNETTGSMARLGGSAEGDDAEPAWKSWKAISTQHLPLAQEWTGTSGTNWGTAGNWANGIPAANNDVIVPSGLTHYPVIDVNTNADCHNLTIESGAQLTINSNSSGNGSLIVTGVATGTASVQRYIKKFTTNNVTSPGNGWHETGCPVANMAVANSDWDPTHTGTKNDLYYWSESDNLWKNYRSAAFDFAAGEGYLVANDEDITHIFTGTLNTSDITFSNLSLTSGKGDGWHLLGNPYSSALKWGDDNWNLSNSIAGTAKVWDENAGNYTDVGNRDIIPSTNGFFIQVTSGTNSLTIPAADRTHDTTNNYKAGQTQKETLKFKVTNDANQYYDVCTLGFKAEATDSCDNAFDSHKLFSIVKAAPSLWTVSNGEDFSTNYLPEITSARDVPIDFKPGVSTVYHLTVQGVNSFENISLVLEDLKTGDKINLYNSDSYDFSAKENDDVHRFVLHISKVTVVHNVNKTNGIQVFAYNNTVYLHGQKALTGRISIFNSLGQEIYKGWLNGAARQQITLNKESGIYFVRLEENGHVFTKKIFIQ